MLPTAQGKDTGNQVRNSQQSNEDADVGSRAIQDAITNKFQDLERKLQLQEQEITELRFSLNDANVATDALEAEKRQLKQRNEQLERKIKLEGDKANNLREDIRKGQDALNKAAEEHMSLKGDLGKAFEKAAGFEKMLQIAQSEIRQVRSLLDESRKEFREAAASAIERNRQITENAEAKVTEAGQQLRRRDADVEKLQDANKKLADQLDVIPERNAQALTTCVKRILSKLDDTRKGILAEGKSTSQQHQEQHVIMVECLKGLLTASGQHVEALATSQQGTEVLTKQLAEKIDAYNCSRLSSETASKYELIGAINNLEKCTMSNHDSFIKSFSSKVRESDALYMLCQQREDDNKNMSKHFSEQLCISQEQVVEIQKVHLVLKNLTEAPHENPEMLAKIFALEDKAQQLEAEIKGKDTQITKLERNYKEQTKALICASEKFASDLQQLASTFCKREEEYHRAVDHAADLATKEAKRASDETKQEIQRELQQERLRRQSLEKELRQAKQDLSVTEENSRRGEQSNEALQKELAAAKLGNQAVTTHLEEKTRTLEQHLDRDSAIITQLKAALAEKEMDYVNLRNSMELYDEKIHVLIEHLRGWAQDYTHIGAIRSGLEMLGQIDQSCAANARIREAEQIDNVLAQIRQYCARQLEKDQRLDFSPGQMKASPILCSSDEGHEQRVADLSAFLEAEVAACKPITHTGDGEKRGSTMHVPVLKGSVNTLSTPANVHQDRSSAMKPPPMLVDRVINVSLEPETSMNPSSPPTASSPVPKRPRRGARASAAQKAAMRNPVSPTDSRAMRRSKRRRPGTSQENAVLTTETEAELDGLYTEASVYFQGSKQDRAPPAGNGETVMASSPQVLIKFEDP